METFCSGPCFLSVYRTWRRKSLRNWFHTKPHQEDAVYSELSRLVSSPPKSLLPLPSPSSCGPLAPSFSVSWHPDARNDSFLQRQTQPTHLLKFPRPKIPAHVPSFCSTACYRQNPTSLISNLPQSPQMPRSSFLSMHVPLNYVPLAIWDFLPHTTCIFTLCLSSVCL